MSSSTSSGVIFGRVIKLGDNVDTDLIYPGKYLTLVKPEEWATHALQGLDPGFPQKLRPGDIVVGGKNFGCGSSRSQAVSCLKYAGVGAVVAVSFARIFFRNAINVGLPVLQCDTSGIGEHDELEIDLGAGEVRDLTTGVVIPFVPLPPVMVTILNDGGLVAHIQKHGDFKLD